MRILVLFSSCILLSSCYSSVYFSTSEKDATIYVDGKAMGMGEAQSSVKLHRGECVNVRVEKIGFLVENLNYCYEKFTVVKKYIELNRDDAFDASISNDYSNKDFEVEVNPKFSEEDCWKIISQIVTSYFDNLEMADKVTGYLKTSWQTKSFSQITVRSRIIVKQSSLEPLKYKIKVISEYANAPNQSVKDDDRFKPWDRLLRIYEPIILEFQDRISKK